MPTLVSMMPNPDARGGDRLRASGRGGDHADRNGITANATKAPARGRSSHCCSPRQDGPPLSHVFSSTSHQALQGEPQPRNPSCPSRGRDGNGPVYCRSSSLLSAPPRRHPIGHAGMTGAIGEAPDRFVAAIGKIRRARIADRPVAFALRQFEERAALRRVRSPRAGPRRHRRGPAIAQTSGAGTGVAATTAAAGRVAGRNAPAPPLAAPATGRGDGSCR